MDKVEELEKRIEVLEAYIKDLQWHIEYKWGLDRQTDTGIWDALRHLASR
jgi:hypothetical protein